MVLICAVAVKSNAVYADVHSKAQLGLNFLLNFLYIVKYK